jgi:putrescine aminotransferase
VGYLRDVREVCTAQGALLVFDEIQSGMGRLGYWWGADREEVTPDIMLAGKGLSGGIVPVSAMIATPEVFTAFNKDPFIHTSTFSAAPIAMAAVRAAVEAIEQDDLVNAASRLGVSILQGLKKITAEFCPNLVKDVRGVGLLIGVEMEAPGLAGALLSELIDRRVIVNYSLNASAVLRLTPPAVMSQDDVTFLLNAFESACKALAKQYPSLGSVGVY